MTLTVGMFSSRDNDAWKLPMLLAKKTTARCPFHGACVVVAAGCVVLVVVEGGGLTVVAGIVVVVGGGELGRSLAGVVVGSPLVCIISDIITSSDAATTRQ